VDTSVTGRQPVYTRIGHVLVIRLDDKPYLELRPAYTADTGPVLVLYRVNGPEDVYLATLRVSVLRVLVRKLPIAMSAAMRLQAKALKTK
jgi:hypothetical protein